MSVSKARHAELVAELLKTEDRRDELLVEQKEAQAAARKELALTAQKIRDLRDILSGREGDQTSIPGTETGLVKPRKLKAAALTKSDGRAMRAAADALVAKVTAKDRSPITRWAADARARKVPTFVVEMTGLRTKAEVVAKFGDMQVFEKGKPCPKPLADAAQRMRARRKEVVAKAYKEAMAGEPKARKTSAKKAAKPFEDVRWVTQEDGTVLGLASNRDVYEIQEVREPFHGFRWFVRGQGRRSGPFPTIAEAQADGVDVDRIRQGQPKLTRATARPAEPTAKAEKKKRGHGTAFTDRVPAWEKLEGEYLDQRKETCLRLVPVEDGRWELQAKSDRERVPKRMGWFRNITRALTLTYDQLTKEALHDDLVEELPRATAEEIAKEKCLTCGVPAGEPSEGCEDCLHGRPADEEEPKVEPALKWKKNQHGLLQADVPGGFYAFEMHPAGWFNAIWQTATGKRAQLDTNATEDHAKAACATHHARRIADMARAAARKAVTA